MTLPESFIKELNTVLGDDTEKYISLFSQPPYRGISVNRLKTTPDRLKSLLPLELTSCPFYKDGFYIPTETQGIGNSPLHHAGAFYVQEPSAMSAVTLLSPERGDRVLDLCAAPGGKSVQIASTLGGAGLLWSNEIVKSRAQILLSNFERAGIRNGVISSLHPDTLCTRLEGFFDKVLVDAPCSGEGMFRKDERALTEWSREHVRACAARQLSVLESGARALRRGGILVYSTCTFSYEENEGVINEFLKRNSDFEGVDISEPFGRKTELSCGIRITPVEGGEGHFGARLRKKGDSDRRNSFESRRKSTGEQARLSENLLEEIFKKRPDGELKMIGDKVYLLPEEMPDISDISIIRAGLLIGELKKNRIEPCHSLFTSFRPEMFNSVLDLSLDDERIAEYLSGSEIDAEGKSGYTAVAFCGITAGFGKCSGGRLKNKYPKGLRVRC